jgi:thiamine biosynthesis lipoprotein
LERSLELYTSTEGAFDVAIYPIMKAWGFTDGNFKVPEAETLEELLTLTDASEILYDGEASTVSFGQENMQIDFGGIAKGYTSARIMDIFRECEVVSGLVNLGGNVQVYSTKTDGSLWRVAIQSPEGSDENLGILSTSDRAVITSGGYERYFEQDGVTYHHIIDPKTGYPAESGLVSVTIISADGTLADGLSTSLFVMGKDRAVDYWENHREEFDMILLSEDGTLYVSEGIEDSFSSDYDIEVIR